MNTLSTLSIERDECIHMIGIVPTKMVTASLTTPAIVTVTALVTDTRTYSVRTCKTTNKLNSDKNEV